MARIPITFIKFLQEMKKSISMWRSVSPIFYVVFILDLELKKYGYISAFLNVLKISLLMLKFLKVFINILYIQTKVFLS